eukprot:s625_g16.t2
MGKVTEKQDEWEILGKLSVKELRILAAKKCVPLTQISTAVEKNDLINLIIKAGPVLDQYDVSVGVKVWTAESIENHQPGLKGKVKKKEKKPKKDKPIAIEDKKRKKGSSESEEVTKTKKRSRSKRRKGGRSRSPSLTMMLPADAPAQVANPEAAMKALLPTKSAAPKVLQQLDPKTWLAVAAALDILDDDDDDEVVACEVSPAQAIEKVETKADTGTKRQRRREPPVVEIVDEKDKSRRRKEAKEKDAKEATKDKEKEIKETEVKEKEIKEKETKEKDKDQDKEKEKADKEESSATDLPAPPPVPVQARKAKDTTAQAGVAAAAALGFNVLPKQSTFTPPSAPALGLRPSINAPIPTPATSNPQGGRVCVQYLCWARCDRGSTCPEAHIMDPEEEMRVRAKFKLQECNQGASCTRTSCLFRHPGERVEEANLGQPGKVF